MRGEIASLQARLGVTTVYVTHDQVEAMTMGHRVAVLSGGRLMQVGTPRELYDAPANTFVAAFIGSPAMNLLTVPLTGGEVVLNGVRVELGDPVAAAAAGLGDLILGLRPEAFELGDDGVPARVELVEELGADAYARCLCDLPEGPKRLTVRVDPWRAPERDERVRLRPRPGEAHAFHVDTGERLGGAER
jgi:multiple sugar transport system ATP-binding protein